jgi:cell division protein FtsB
MRWLRFRPRLVIEPAVPIFDTDARRHDSPRAKEPTADVESGDTAPRPRRRRLRILIWNAIFIGGTVFALFGQGGYLDLRRKEAELDEARHRVAERRAAVEAEREAVERLRVDPVAKERIAREQLGLAPPGEVQFLLPREGEGTLQSKAPEPE